MGWSDFVDAAGNLFDGAGNIIGNLAGSSGDWQSLKNSVATVGPAPMLATDGPRTTASAPTATDAGPPPISDQEVLQGLIALGYSTGDAIDLLTNSPDTALLLVQAGIPAQGGGGGSSSGGGGGGGADYSLGYAQLAENQRQFDLEYQTGLQQFNATFDRKNFESDREYQLAQEQFAQTYAENKRQFDMGYGLDSKALDLQTELGRGNLSLGQDRLSLDRELGMGQLGLGRDQLNLDSELGRGRLALDSELGRGRLALDDRLGTGRLNLDTELGRGQLGVNQQGELRQQRAQVAAERLANRDQELQRTQFVTDVLRKPSDFLARAFMQRGGTAPTGMVTQADIINNLKSSINQFAEGGTTNDTMFTTGEQGGSGSTELILNPANAPLQVLNPQQTQQVVGAPANQAAPQWGDLLGRLRTWRDQLPQQWGSQMPQWNGQMPQFPQIQNNTNPAAMEPPPTPTWGYQGGGRNPNHGGEPYTPGRLNQSPYGDGMQQQGAPVQGGAPQYGIPPSSPSIQPVNNSAPAPSFGAGGVGYNPGAMQPGSTPDWAAAFAATNDTINPMTLPNVTQQQLVDIGLQNLPPAVKAALFGGGGSMPAARPVANLTPGRLSRLTPGELEALNTQLGVQYNTDLQNELALLQERFGPVVDRARGRLVVQ